MDKKEIKETEELLELIDNTRKHYRGALENLIACHYNIQQLAILNPKNNEITELILKKIENTFDFLKENRLKLT